MKNNKIGIFAIAILVIVALFLAIFGPMVVRKRAVKESGVQQIKDTFVSAKGVVESAEEIEIGSQVSGVIAEIKADEGDMVKKGQPLVILESAKVTASVKKAEAMLGETKARLRELESGYRAEDIEMAKNRARRAEAVYQQANDEHQRLNRLYRKDAATRVELDRAEEKMKVSLEELNESKANLKKFQQGARQEEIEQARAVVDKAASELKQNKAILRDYYIHSPIDGVVAERLKDPDETVDVGTPVMKLVNMNKLRIRVELEETDVGKIVEGQAVEIYTDTHKDKIYHGKVYKVVPVVKRKSVKTFDPVASFDINAQAIFINLDDFTGLKNGMTVTVRFMK